MELGCGGGDRGMGKDLIKKWRGVGDHQFHINCIISSQNPPMKILAGRFVSCSQAQRGCALQYSEVYMHTHNIYTHPAKGL